MRPSVRRAASIATIALGVLVAAGCSPSDDATVEATAAPATTVTVAETTTSTTNAAADIDVRDVLAKALARYEDGYAFDAVASVEGAEAASVEGVVIGNKAQMTITSGDATVTYIITPDQSWIQTEGGDWQEDESAATVDRPLDDLAAPTSITIVSANDGSITALAAYDGAAFDTEGSVDMDLRFIDGLLVSASYTTDTATVTTTFAPLTDEVIVVPVPSA